MNVLLQNRFFLVLLLAWAPFVLSAQIVPLTTYQNVPIQYAFVSTPNSPSIVVEPQHGTRQLVQSPAFNYTLTYTPAEDYVGTDFIRISYWASPSLFRFFEFHITILPANVTANPDHATTAIGVPVVINVLANDFSSNGTLILTGVPLANNGLTAFQSGSSTITFTPAADYVGLAHLNYIVCDGAGTCDNGVVSISVVGPSLPDTLQVFTKKNQAQSILVPSDYILAGSPQHGSYATVDGIPQYTPAQDYIGLDYMTYDYQGQVKVVRVDVLNIADNVFAFDDVINTTSYSSVEFNVLDNDLYGTNAGCPSIGTPLHGSLQTYPGIKGLVRYTPPTGFTGVDQFTYTSRAVGCSGASETATVRIFVSNFEPARSKFEMSTPKRTPLIIGYDVPISDFQFQITDQGDIGAAVFLEGFVDTTIYGSQITGYNLILYIPGEDIEEGTDEFEIRYCVTNEDGDCTYQKTVKVEMEILNIGTGDGPMCFGDCVWPGDTNFDGVVNMEDILPLGLSMGEVGKPRANATLSTWYGQYADNWINIFDPLAVDLKHLDTDGDSLVTALDTAAISLYYGRTHSLTPMRIPYYENEIVLAGDIFASPGDLVELDMVLGSAANPARNVYGFTFPFSYNPVLFVPESVDVEFYRNSWLTYSSPVLHMSRNHAQDGLLEAGYTRTSGLAASGHGEIGKLRFIVTDDINGFREGGEGITVEFASGVATGMSGSGQTYGIPVRGFTLHIVPKKELDQPTPISVDQVKVYPNPASDRLNVHLNGGYEMEEVTLFNLAGQQVYNANVRGKRTMMDIANLQTGLYFLKVQTDHGVVTKKVEIVR